MNLEELKIKVSLDLKDLNKQLSGISDSINKTFTSSVKKMAKTADKEVNVMAKDINKTLNKAFTLDSRKFDADVTRTMDKAKRTVRSACKEIRAELNKAFNIDGHIRVTASSKSNMTNSSSSNTNSAIAASSQYTGAMIIKATNAIISNNNSNTARLERAINGLAGEIASAMKKIGVTVKPEITVNVPDVTVNVFVAKTKTKSTNNPVIIELDENSVRVTEESIKGITDGLIDLRLETGKVNFELGKTGEIFVGTIIRMREAFNMIKSLGTSGINFELGKGFLDESQVKAMRDMYDLMKKIRSLNKALVSDTTSFTLDEEGSQTLTGKVVSNPKTKTESGTKGITQKEIIIPASFKVIDDDLKEQVEKTIDRIKRLNLDIPISTTLPRLNEPDNSNPQLPQLSSLQLPTVYEVDKSQTEALREANKLIEECYKSIRNINSAPLMLMPPDATAQLENLQTKISKITGEFESILGEVQLFDIDPTEFTELFGDVREYGELLIGLHEQLTELDKERTTIDIDTSKAEDRIKKLQDTIEHIVQSISRASNEGGRIAEWWPGLDTEEEPAPPKRRGNKPQRPQRPQRSQERPNNTTTIGFGFGAYKNEIEKIMNALKQISFKDIFNPNVGPAKLEKALQNLSKTTRKVADTIVNSIGKAFSTVSKIAKSSLGVVESTLTAVGSGYLKIIEVYRTGFAIMFKLLAHGFKEGGISGAVKTTGKALSSGLKNMIQEVKGLLQRVLGPIYDVLSNLFSKIGKGIKAVYNIISHIIDNIKNVIVNVVDRTLSIIEKAIDKTIVIVKQIGKTIADIAKAINNKLAEAFSYVLDVVGKTVDKCIDLFKRLWNTIVDISKKIGDVITTVANKAIDVVSNAIDKVIEVSKKVGKTITDVANKIHNTLVNIIDKALDAIGIKIDKIIEIAKKLGKTIADVANRIHNILVNVIDKALDVIGAKIDKVIEVAKKLGKVINDVAHRIHNALVNVIDKAIDAIGIKIDKVVEIAKNFGRAVSDVASKINNALANVVGKSIDFVESKLDKLVGVVSSVFTRIKTEVMIGFAHAIDVVVDKFNGLANAVSKAYGYIVNLSRGYDIVIRKYFNKVISYADGLVNKVAQPIKTVMSSVVTAVKNQYIQLTAAIEYSINNIIDSVTDSVKNQYVQLVAAINYTFNQIVTAVKNQYVQIVAATKYTFNQIATAIKNQYIQISAAIKYSISKIVNPIKNVATKVKDTVKGLMTDASELAKGCFNKVSSYSSSVAKRISEAFVLSANSISKLSKGIKGKVLGIFKQKREGFIDVNKIQQSLNKIKNSAKKTAKSIKGSFDSATGAIGQRLRKNGSIFTGSNTGNISKGLNKTKGVISKFASTTRAKLNSAFTGLKSNKLYANISKTLGKAKSTVSKFASNVRSKLNTAFAGIKTSKLYSNVSKALNKAKSAVSKFASKVKPILNKAFSGIKVGTKVASTISKGLGKGLGALKKFASSCKTMWSKIRGIFHKGATDASRATGKLATGLKALLANALGFFSLYSLINLGKQAITQSQTLAQAEIKLTSLMKQRMGATNDTVKAIRQLVKEQARLGVVSETALTRGAEQLSMYVHSAKALKELMPAIANLTAKRGGFMATEDDAEEIATQLGEAIREGTTTPLEQSGIYLSEAEIEKFKHLTTEEARAKFLADEIAKSVGDINKALANTPIGAMTQLKNNFKELLGTLGIFLANVLKPIVQWLNVIVVACNNALKALGKLLGFDMTGGADSIGDIGTGGGSTAIDTGGVDSATDSYNDAADAADKATEANEKFKGSLAGFDEINVLSDNTNKDKDSDSDSDYDPTDITPGVGGQLPSVGEMTEGENIFGKFGEKMKAFIDEFLEPFKAAWDLLGNDLKEEWADLKDSFKNFCDSLGNFLKSVWDNGGKEFVQHMAEIGLACGKAAMEIGGEILDSLARLWDHLDPAKNMNTQGLLNALNEVSVKIRDFVLGLGDHFESLMANGGQDALNAMGDMFMNLGEAAVRGFGLVIDALDGLIDHLDPATNQFTKDMLKAWENAFHSVGQCALDFVDLLESTLENGGQDIINALGDLCMKVGEAFAVIIDECAKTLSELFKHMDPETNPHSKKMLESIEGLIESITNFVDACIDAFKRFMDSGGRDVVKNLGDIAAIVIDLAATLGSGIIDLITGFMNSWVGQKLIEGVAEALKWVTEKLVALSDVIDVVKEIFRDLIDAIVGVFEGDGEKVGRAFAKLIKGAFKLTGEILEWLLGIAVDLVEGLVKGICSLPKLLWEAVKFLFDTIIGFFKELFGIHSPSKVFADLGKDIVQGLIDGITGMISKAVKAISDLGKNILEGAKTIVKDTVAKFKEVKDGVVEKLKETREKAAEKWSEIKEDAGNYCSKLVETAQNKYSKVKEKVSGILSETAKDMSKKWEDMKKDTADKCKSIYDDVTTKFSNTKKDAINALGNIKQEVSNKWNEVKESTSNIISTMKENASQSYDKLKENLGNTISKWNESSSKTWDTIKEKTCTTASKLKDEASETYETLKSNLSNTLEKTREVSANAWDKVKSTTSEMISKLTGETSSSYDDMKEKISNKLEDVKNKTGAKWTEINNDAKSKITDIVKDASTKFGDIKNGFTNKLTDTKSALVSKWNDLKSQAYDSAKGIAEKAKSGLSNIGQTIATSITNGKSKVSSALNEIGRLFKNANWELPKIKLPHIKVTGDWSFNPPRVPKFSIQWNKRGGIIDGITPLGFANGALQMGGEAGKEMIVPLENTSFTSKIAQAMAQAVDNTLRRNYNNMNNNSGGINDNRDIILKVDGRELARTSIKQINNLQKEAGRTLLDI